MVAIIFCFVALGILIGCLESFLFFSFDKNWKKLIDLLFGGGSTGGVVVGLFKLASITSQEQILWSITVISISVLGSFIVASYVFCRLIKDKNNPDILRMRDLLFNQVTYINHYYELRQKEIDDKLGIEKLEQRERRISQRERACKLAEEHARYQLKMLKSKANNKLHLDLPDKQVVALSQDYIDKIPSFLEDFSKFSNALNQKFGEYVNDKMNVTMEELRAFSLDLSQLVLTYLFGNSTSIRVHFRYFDRESNKYEELAAITGDGVSSTKLTPIPYENSMIEKSFLCQRAVIKSINADSDYSSHNHAKWQDYITYSFIGLVKDGKPYLTFGISVKNAARWKELLYFLSYIKIENYLNDNVESYCVKGNVDNLLFP